LVETVAWLQPLLAATSRGRRTRAAMIAEFLSAAEAGRVKIAALGC
jgi:hypothetical protein